VAAAAVALPIAYCACSLPRSGILGENLQLPPSWTEDHRGFYIINATTLTVRQQPVF
jgi:hypothetical protein